MPLQDTSTLTAERLQAILGNQIRKPLRGNVVMNSDGTNPAVDDGAGEYVVYVKLTNQPEILLCVYNPFKVKTSELTDGMPVLIIKNGENNYELIGVDTNAIAVIGTSLPSVVNPTDIMHDHTEPNLRLGTNSVITDAITDSAVTTAKIADSAVTNAKLAGTITVSLGGTGSSTLTANNLIVGAGTSAVTFIAPSTSANILQSNGTLWQSVAPSFSASVITSGTLSVARGGTGAGTFTTGAVLLGNGTSAISALSGTNPNDVLTWNGSAWVSQAPSSGAGTVTSVALSLPSDFTVSGSPVTTSGTLTAVWASQLQNRVLASPDGSSGTPTFRALVSADIPNLDTSKITSGTLSVARGGTGATTFTTGAVLLGNGTSAISALSGSVSGHVLTWNGSAWISQAPATSGTVTSVGLTSTSLTVTGSPITSSGTLTVNLPLPTTQADANQSFSFGGQSNTLRYALSNTTGVILNFEKWYGTIASPISTGNSTVLGQITFRGYTGLGTVTGASITANTTAAWTTGNQATNLVLATRTTGGVATNVLTLNADATSTFAAGVTVNTGNFAVSAGTITASGNITATSGNLTGDTLILDTDVGTTDGQTGYDGSRFAYYSDGLKTRGMSVMNEAFGATSRVINTAVETAFALGFGFGTNVFPSNYLAVAGRKIIVRAGGFFNTTGTPTLRLRLFLGSTAVFTSGTITTPSGASNLGWFVEVHLIVDTVVTTTSTIKTYGYGAIGTANYFTDAGTAAGYAITNNATVTMELRATWGTASVSNEIQSQSAEIVILN